MNAEQPKPRGELIFDMPREKYDRLQRVNYSSLKVLGKSAAHYLHHIKCGSTDKAAYKIGRATHIHVYEPERVTSSIAVWGGKVRSGERWERFRAEHDGLDILTQKEDGDVRAIANAVRSHPAALKYVNGGKAEPTLLWTHTAPEVGGLPGYEIEMKGRPDFIANCGALVDLKTCVDASPEGFGRAAWKYGYHVQAAIYSDGHEAVTGQRLPYVLIAVEKSLPHVVAVYVVPEHILEIGRETYRALLDRLNFCRSESKWPGYGEGEEAELQLPSWATPDDFDEDHDVSDLGITFHDDEGAEA